MGWTGIPWSAGAGLQRFLKTKFTWSSERGSNEPVFYSKSGFGTHFLGIKHTAPNGAVTYWLAVVLTEFSLRGPPEHRSVELYYKELEESEGPCELANKRTLEWLKKFVPEPPNEFAQDWRTRSAAQVERRSKRRSDWTKARHIMRSEGRAAAVSFLESKGYSVR